MLNLANDFGGVVDATGNGVTLTDVNLLNYGTINALPGQFHLTSNSVQSTGVASGSGGSSIFANSMSGTLQVSVPGAELVLDGGVPTWTLSGASPKPVPVTVSSPNIVVTYNGATIVASVAIKQAANASSTVSATVAATATEEANKTFGTDSVAADVEYGFAGEIGATPPMDHRIDESGISLPRCVTESREGVPCK
jgi:hypothetical protein